MMKWGVWNITFRHWVFVDSWHATEDAAQRECDAWARMNGCKYEVRKID